MGEEDAICLRNFSKNVTCKSHEGELLVMTIQDFFQRVKPNDESWAKICQNSAIKQGYLHTTVQKKLQTSIESFKDQKIKPKTSYQVIAYQTIDVPKLQKQFPTEKSSMILNQASSLAVAGNISNQVSSRGNKRIY